MLKRLPISTQLVYDLLLAVHLPWQNGLASSIFLTRFLMEPSQDGKPVSYWILNLGTSGSGSEAALDKLGPERTIPYLLRALRGKYQPVSGWQRFYARHYAKIPTFLRKRLAAPLPGLAHARVDRVQVHAAYYLVHLAEHHPSEARMAVSQLVPLLEHSDGNTRFSAGIALSGFGSNAAPAIPAIENLLLSNPGKIHDIMLIVLEKCGPQAKRTIPALQQYLGSATGHSRIQCAKTLWRLDSSQADFVRPVAHKLSAAKDPRTRLECASLLWRMDKDAALVVPILIGLLKENYQPFDFRTLLLLKQIGPAARDAIPALAERLNRTDRESSFRSLAEEALRAMRGPAAAPAITNASNLAPIGSRQ